MIDVEDHGAGSFVIRSNKRAVRNIARSSLKNKKFAQLIHRIVKYYKPTIIVELGTSFGITTSYMASANFSSMVYSLEASENIGGIARNTFEKLALKNIELIHANFNDALPQLQEKIDKIDFAFIDGNHRKAPTLNYFSLLLQKITGTSILIFDDIHWSAEMEEAWKQIQQHTAVTLTIDLFFIGLVFFNKDFKSRQHFVIRF